MNLESNLLIAKAHNLIKQSSRRRHKRFPVHLNARIHIGSRHYDGIVGNISEEGLAYTITTFLQTDKGFVPNGEITITINIPSGGKLNLRCEIRWFLKPSEKGKSLLMGMKIIEPPSKYKDWIKEVESRLSNHSDDKVHLF